MVRGGQERANVSLDVMWVSELTWHSDAAAQPLSDTHTSKASFPPWPSLFLLLHSTYPASGKHGALVSPSHNAKPTRTYCKTRAILWQEAKLIQKTTENNYTLELRTAFYKTACLTFALPQWLLSDTDGQWSARSLCLYYHTALLWWQARAQDSVWCWNVTLGQDGAGAARCSHVTHFCNIANMINIADTGMQLLLPWLLQ